MAAFRSVLVSIVAVVGLCSRFREGAAKRQGASAQELEGTSASMACLWQGPESSGVFLSFPMDQSIQSQGQCKHSCKAAKFEQFTERFDEGLSSQFMKAASGMRHESRCKCSVLGPEGQADQFFSFLAARASFCAPSECWKVYTQHADLAKPPTQRISQRGNFESFCSPCPAEGCKPELIVRRIGFSKSQLSKFHQLAEKGDSDAIDAKRIIEEHKLEFSGSATDQLAEDDDEELVEDEDVALEGELGASHESVSETKSHGLSVDVDADHTGSDEKLDKRTEGSEKFFGENDKRPDLSVDVDSDHTGSDEKLDERTEGSEKFFGENDKRPDLSVDVDSDPVGSDQEPARRPEDSEKFFGEHDEDVHHSDSDATGGRKETQGKIMVPELDAPHGSQNWLKALGSGATAPTFWAPDMQPEDAASAAHKGSNDAVVQGAGGLVTMGMPRDRCTLISTSSIPVLWSRWTFEESTCGSISVVGSTFHMVDGTTHTKEDLVKLRCVENDELGADTLKPDGRICAIPRRRPCHPELPEQGGCQPGTECRTETYGQMSAGYFSKSVCLDYAAHLYPSK